MLRRHTHGFTLLEICLAIVIGLLIVTLAVPSIKGVMADQRLKETFERFDALARKAQSRAVSERRTFVLSWEKDAVVLRPLEPGEDDRSAEIEQVTCSEGETFLLDRPVAMEKKPAPEWVFWRSGICEPAIISYEGPEGTWKAEYNALTGRSTFLEKNSR